MKKTSNLIVDRYFVSPTDSYPQNISQLIT